MEPKLIGLSGKKQSGKDTVYQLADSLMEDAKIGRVAFGDAVRHEVSEITGYRMDFIEEHKSEFRTLLQVWGTDFRRHFNGSDYWLEKMAEVVDKASSHYDVLFITDVRFSNEAEWLKSIGGKLVKVERRQEVYRHIEDAIPDCHSSETAMDDYSKYDYVINNNGSENELLAAVSAMLSTLKIQNAA
jgi:phosphomevalonate kinase